MPAIMKKPSKISPSFDDLFEDEPQAAAAAETAAEEVSEQAAAEVVDGMETEDISTEEVAAESTAETSEVASEATEAIAEAISETGEVDEPGETVSETASEPAAESPPIQDYQSPLPPASPDDEATAAFNATVDFERRKAAAEELFLELAINRAKLEVALKNAKKQEKDALEELSDLIDHGPEMPRPKPAPIKPATTASDDEATDVAPDSGEVVSTADCSVSVAWRDVPVSALGLKPKLEERLVESSIATIGQLEDLRAKIGDRREEWPKGIGEAKITAIEDAVLAWLAKNRDRITDSTSVPVTVVDEASETSTAGETSEASSEVGQDGETEAAGDGTGHADIDAANEEWESMTTQQQCEWLNARCVQVDSDNLFDIDLRNTDSEEQWQEGADAFDADDQAHNCPYSPGVDCDAWLQGWLWKGKQETFDTSLPPKE